MLRKLWMLTILATCSLMPGIAEDATAGTQKLGAKVTLKNLIRNANVDLVAHPLICDANGDFPKGQELIFIQSGSDKIVHAVFPDKASAPKDLTGIFELSGHYQVIQKKDRFKRHRKEFIEQYRYFVVSSCKKIKREQNRSTDADQ